MKNTIQLFDNQDKKISQRFKEARESTGLSKTEFSRKAGLHQSQVSEIENNTRNITADILLKMEVAFNLNWKYIAKGQGSVYLEKSSVINESDPYYGQVLDINELKEEVKLWKNRYLEINDKYTALLEGKPKVPSPIHDKRTAG